ncbi:MAG: M14 family metallopeptidase, partial [Acidimicrobiia bacterium]
NTATGAHDEKPAVWLDGNIHASEVTASVALLHLVETLCARHGADDRITRVLDSRTFYVVPRVNPDGAELALAEVPFVVRANTRSWPHAEQQPGLVAGDVDHDGRSLQMRVQDPNGTWKPHPAIPKLLVPREPDEDGPGPYYRLFPEGWVVGYDGVDVPAAPPRAGIDSNRNFPYRWRRYDKAAFGAGNGDFPTSEPEVRAVVEGVVARPNVGAYFAQHTYSGVLLRPYSDRPDDDLPSVDRWTYDDLGRRATQITGYPHVNVYDGFRYDPKDAITGVADDWAYDQRGIFAWTTEFWNPLTAAGIEDPHPIEWYRDHPLDDELRLLAWVEENVPGGYVDWYPYEHAELGPVELGGWDHALVFSNPPPHLLEAEVAPHTELAVFTALCLPELRLRETSVERLGDDAWQVQVIVENAGWLPTNVTQQAIDAGVIDPVEARVSLPEGASLVHGRDRIGLGQLAGRALRRSSVGTFGPPHDGTADRAVARWTVRAPAGARLAVEVRAARAGVVRTEVVLDA